MANCNATTLLAEARQLSGLSEKQLDMAVAVLLKRWFENTETASELLLQAKCFQCLSKKQLLIAWAQLLCRTVEPDTLFSYQPESAIVSWVDDNGSFSGTLSQLKSTADIGSITSITFPNGDVTSVSYLSALPVLSVLNISGNPIDSFDLSGCGSLTQLFGANCQLAGTLDLTSCPTLIDVYVNGNAGVTGITLTGLAALSRLDINNCLITGTLDVSPCTALTILNCQNNNGLTDITFPPVPILTNLNSDDAEYSFGDLDVSSCTLLTYLNLRGTGTSQAGVNTILVNLVANGLDGGYADLSYQTPPAAPSGAGAAALITLTGYPNPWTILTD